MQITAEKRRLTDSQGAPLSAQPLAGGLFAAVVASLCCGGSLVFASIGLGALYASLGLSRYIPQVLVAGTLTIVVINWLFYRRRALSSGPTCDYGVLRRAMYMSALLGLAVMVVSFLFVEWLNHAVVNPAHFMTQPKHASAVLPGIPNDHLLYAALSFAGLALLRLLPFPAQSQTAAG